jgi:putative transposase
MTRLTRKNPRLTDYDYANAGAYFVTICTHQRQLLFGSVRDDMVELNQCGQIATRAWRDIPMHFQSVHLDEFIVMPNHVHGILFIDGELAGHAPPLQQRPTLGVIMGAYKSATTRLINQIRGTAGTMFWQRNYYEHVIRNDISLAEIRQYIANNPLQWALDKYFHPAD